MNTIPNYKKVYDLLKKKRRVTIPFNGESVRDDLAIYLFRKTFSKDGKACFYSLLPYMEMRRIFDKSRVAHLANTIISGVYPKKQYDLIIMLSFPNPTKGLPFQPHGHQMIIDLTSELYYRTDVNYGFAKARNVEMTLPEYLKMT